MSEESWERIARLGVNACRFYKGKLQFSLVNYVKFMVRLAWLLSTKQLAMRGKPM
ncbi:Uncharacterised protein [Moraxella caprae]|uniref:Uncharacterized protein n=1 Tax=Moraxella caprae TaxID=90240 RepID=A0A378QYF5_9GAMM|nr:Uncharacterised protein [Moraxella caprae]